MAFPMPGQSGTVVPVALTQRPFTMTLENGVEWWWRVKRWRIEINLPILGAKTIDLERSAAVDERDRCDPANFTWLGFIDETVGGDSRILRAELHFLPPEDEVIQDPPSWFQSVTIAYPYYLEVSNASQTVRSLFPACVLIIYFDVVWTQGSDYDGAFVSHTDAETASGPYDGTLVATIDGINCTMAYTSGTNSWAGTTIAMTILEWWTWADVGGANPTWNSTTGERL